MNQAPAAPGDRKVHAKRAEERRSPRSGRHNDRVGGHRTLVRHHARHSVLALDQRPRRGAGSDVRAVRASPVSQGHGQRGGVEPPPVVQKPALDQARDQSRFEAGDGRRIQVLHLYAAGRRRFGFLLA